MAAQCLAAGRLAMQRPVRMAADVLACKGFFAWHRHATAY